jgi:membrane protease YdiL (CAAX protease family)
MATPELEREGIPPAVWLFLVLAFGISWATFGIRRAFAWPDPVDEVLRLTVKFGPSLAGLIAAFAVAGVAGLRDIVRRLVPFGFRPAWAAFALITPGLIFAAALALRGLLGGDLTRSDLVGWAAAAAFLALLATRFFAGGGLGEELGWRGFMLPYLLPRMGALRASVVIGVAHGLWHLPAYGAVVIVLTALTVAMAIIFTWMYQGTGGNLFLPALMHASGNASLPFLERLYPELDNDALLVLLSIALWAALAAAVAWGRLDPEGVERSR